MRVRNLGLLLSLLGLPGVACMPLGDQSADPDAPDAAAPRSYDRIERLPSPAGDGGARGLDASAPVEQCNGWDDDGDGRIDEGTGGERCDGADGPGTMSCVRGALQCLRCTPGERRTEPCGCGQDRVDVCNESGRWVQGACDGCPAEYVPAGCDAPGACNPGDEEYRACDYCQPGSDTCGTQCVGARWRCGASCVWEQVTPCEVVNVAECRADQEITEGCGACGTRKVVCDGCFWVRLPCQDQGACRPGQTRIAPCFDSACGEGLSSTVTCDSTCRWSAPEACSGCLTGAAEDATESCVAGHPMCGVKVSRTACVGEAVGACGGSVQVVQGQETTTVVRDDCPNVQCTPGESEDLGACPCPTQRRTRACGEDCRWQLHECPTPICVPGTTEQRECYGGDGRQTFTCTDCGWGPGGGCIGVVTGLPCECTSGTKTTYKESCGPSAGCKQRLVTKTCVDCRWQRTEGACDQPPPCSSADSTTTDVSCGPDACGRTYTVTRTCDLTSTCSMRTTSNQATACPVCDEGETRATPCTTSGGACGTQTQACDATCTWGASSACQARDGSCTPGQTVTRPCTTSVQYCGAPGTETLRCASDGCGMDVVEACRPTDSSVCARGASQSFGTCACGSPDLRNCDSTCHWGPSSCSNPCTKGATSTEACTWACGLAGTRTARCDGCVWQEVSSCTPNDSTRCQPGQTMTAYCPDQPGGKLVTCGSDCRWPGC